MARRHLALRRGLLMTGFQLPVISVFSTARSFTGFRAVPLPFETSQNCVGLLEALFYINFPSMHLPSVPCSFVRLINANVSDKSSCLFVFLSLLESL